MCIRDSVPQHVGQFAQAAYVFITYNLMLTVVYTMFQLSLIHILVVITFPPISVGVQGSPARRFSS